MSGRYNQHPMERKFHEDMEKHRKVQARIALCWKELQEELGEDFSAEMAFRAGYAQGNFDARSGDAGPAPEQGPQ